MYAAINCVGCVKKVVTELVVLEVTQNGLVERAPEFLLKKYKSHRLPN
jgi:acyl CoA:acetate/3-ketoacid CoA transferase beta subunit